MRTSSSSPGSCEHSASGSSHAAASCSARRRSSRSPHDEAVSRTLSSIFRGRPRLEASISKTPPDIVIEVITATPRDNRRDRVEKKRDYASLGVRQYWLVDPHARTLEVLALGGDGRFVEALCAATGRHDVPGCDGLLLDLDALWAELDRWAADGT